MEKVFIDTDIILDLIMKRKPYYFPAAKLFKLIENKKISGHVSSLIFSNLYYIIRKSEGNEKAKDILKKLKLLVKIISVNEKIIELGLSSNFKDFEDSIQYYAAIENGIKNLITRNVDDYKKAKINVFTAEEYINLNG
jgi:predicted nucleic acid-binding protein